MSRIYPYAGFWKRAIAFIIDSIVISIPTTLISIPLMFFKFKDFFTLIQQGDNADPGVALNAIMQFYGLVILLNLLGVIIFWLYYALMESGKKQATLGKMAMGIKVVGADGGRITFARATGRTFGKYISFAIMYFGCYMAGFTKKRQALHDLMASTYVVDNSLEPNNELPEHPFSVGGLIASIVVTVAPFVLLFILGLMSALMMGAGASSIEGARQDAFLGLNASIAEGQLIMCSLDKDEAAKLPFTENDITYSRAGKNYRAEWKDEDGGTYRLLLQEGQYAACCEMAPDNNCSATRKPACK